MSQTSLSHTVIVLDDTTKASLKELFFDNDFTENVEYFRDDTLELGYDSEADRLAEELSTSAITSEAKIEACVEAQVESDSSYYADHSIDITKLDGKYVVSVATMVYA